MSTLTPRTNSSDTPHPHSSPMYGSRYTSLGAGVGLGMSPAPGQGSGGSVAGSVVGGVGGVGGGGSVGRHVREGSGMQSASSRVRTASVAGVGVGVGVGALVREASGRSASPAVHPAYYHSSQAYSQNSPPQAHAHSQSQTQAQGYGHGQHVREGSGVRRQSAPSHHHSQSQQPQPHAHAGQPFPYGYGSYGRRNSQLGLPSFAPQPVVVDDKYWVEGDFELVTADGVRFRVPSYYLFAAR